MSTYSLEIPEKLNYLAIVEYAKKYTAWKNVAVSAIECDDDDEAITGEELKHVIRISKFLKISAFRTSSIMDIVQMLWGVVDNKPETEGQAKRIVLNKL